MTTLHVIPVQMKSVKQSQTAFSQRVQAQGLCRFGTVKAMCFYTVEGESTGSFDVMDPRSESRMTRYGSPGQKELAVSKEQLAVRSEESPVIPAPSRHSCEGRNPHPQLMDQVRNGLLY